MKSRKHQILDFLHEHGPATRRECEFHFQVAFGTQFVALHEQGFIEVAEKVGGAVKWRAIRPSSELPKPLQGGLSEKVRKGIAWGRPRSIDISHEQVAADVEAYLAKGGQIKVAEGFPERPVTHRVGHGHSWGISG